MKFLGIEHLFISNASGGVNPDYKWGFDGLNDHINLIPSPLVGTNLDTLGPRFPDMSDAYERTMIEKALKIVSIRDIVFLKEYMQQLLVLVWKLLLNINTSE